MLYAINRISMLLVLICFALCAGSGLVSRSKYHYGFFSAAVKLPAGLSSGVVVAFYVSSLCPCLTPVNGVFIPKMLAETENLDRMFQIQLSNADAFPHSHDEIDIELLGHDKRNDWVLRSVLRTARFCLQLYNSLQFGPCLTSLSDPERWWFQLFSWRFFVDNIPVREFPSSGVFSSTYPSKPMSVYATIWDGSQWATHGGKYPVNYKYAPFVVSLAETEMVGCVSNPRQQPLSSCSNQSTSSGSDPVEGQDFAALSQQQITAMQWARSKLMFYSYCKDTSRFKVMPPECK